MPHSRAFATLSGSAKLDGKADIRTLKRGGTFMTILSQRGVIRLLALSLLLILPATTGAQQRAPVVEKLAKTYGLGSFGQIEAIRYTFSAQAPGVDLFRSWTW